VKGLVLSYQWYRAVSGRNTIGEAQSAVRAVSDPKHILRKMV
jgi:hypothetical protein